VPEAQEIEWSPQKAQLPFLTSPADETFFGGAAGGGKTDVALAWQILRRQKYAGSRGMFLRRQFENLSKPGAAIDRAHELLAGTDVYWRGDEHSFYWPNGSRLAFGHVKEEKNKFGYQGAQVDDIVFDELGEFPVTIYEFITTRIRSTRSDPGFKTKVRATGNPGGMGHAWIKKRFRIGEAMPGQVFPIINSEGKLTHKKGVFYPSLLRDNKYLVGTDYERDLDALPEHLRRAFKEGDWSVFEGQFFADWSEDRMVVKQPFVIPLNWPRWMSYDYGFKPGWACWHWWAQDPITNRRYVYRELYVQELHPPEQARKVLKMTPVDEQHRIRAIYCDPSIFNSRKAEMEGLPSIAEEIALEGVRPLFEADNRRAHGWSVLRTAMQWCRWAAGISPKCNNEVCLHNPYPQIQYFPECYAAIRTIPELVHDPMNPMDIIHQDPKIEDHAADCDRYGIVGARRVQALPTPGHARRLRRRPVRIKVA